MGFWLGPYKECMKSQKMQSVGYKIRILLDYSKTGKIVLDLISLGVALLICLMGCSRE